MRKENKNDEMFSDYDFSKSIRGKYSKRYAEGTNIVMINPDLQDYFPDQKSVNEALRGLVNIIKKHERVEQPAADQSARYAFIGFLNDDQSLSY